MTNEERLQKIVPPTIADVSLASVDNIGNPHLYCITPKHLSGDSMYLGTKEIKEAEEKYGAKCDTCVKSRRRNRGGTILSFDEHKERNILFVEILARGRKPADIPGLQEYLLSIKDSLEAVGIEGIAFVEKVEKKQK